MSRNIDNIRKRKSYEIVINNEVLDKYTSWYFEQHPRARKAPIKLPYHESINQWMIMRRPMMNALKQKWKSFICWLAEEEGYSNLNIARCIITQTVYYPTQRRHDTDNSVPKFILDGLVDSRVIKDDDMKVVTELRLKCDIDTECPRTVINIDVIE